MDSSAVLGVVKLDFLLNFSYSEQLKMDFSFLFSSVGSIFSKIMHKRLRKSTVLDSKTKGEKGAHILLVLELDFLTSSLDKIKNVSVTCEKIPLLALESNHQASAGYKISRSKMANLIRYFSEIIASKMAEAAEVATQQPVSAQVDLSKLGRHEEDGSLSTTTTMKGCGPFVSAEGLEQLHRFLASLVFFKDV
ncbi:hypothetical protein PHJA_000625200 [Phtheirospermum japonicum]|uniref:Uncharacterized protein n=1 Tax=Phtheirospermum japonicum TaxID=374723 RepID=A0A830BJC3_9LAMI|nr:hypothetical protein PHJA_000625200 [Phtheirospermum japonicum]